MTVKMNEYTLTSTLLVVKTLKVNARMPECQKKSQSGIVIFPEVNRVRPASAFRHQGQSDAAGHGLVQHCPAMVFLYKKICSRSKIIN
jgi:hypothetical protein